ncbi:MAG TPA: hypothetical protein VER17_20460 [Tepidisphaeraceae bacterium]|nr:hypothetical protein [Tepidisphaeraceae bacterium]
MSRGILFVNAIVLAAAAAAAAAVVVTGCASRDPIPRAQSDAALFAPVSMRIHPIFSGVKDWTGDGAPDGLEALLEFEDQFADPTKASGSVIFELFTFRTNNPDPRGERVVNPWLGSLQTLADQQARWNRTSRTYLFQLEYPAVSEQQDYVLTATFDTGTTRYFDRVVLEGRSRPRGGGGSGAGTSAPPVAPATRRVSTAPIATSAGDVPAGATPADASAGAPDVRTRAPGGAADVSSRPAQP